MNTSSLQQCIHPYVLLTAVVKKAGHEGKIKFANDHASSEFYSEGKYDLGFKIKKPCWLSASDLADLYSSLMEKYPIILLEDPFAEGDWAAWSYHNPNYARNNSTTSTKKAQWYQSIVSKQ